MRERVLRFGSGSPLIGVTTEPPSGAASDGRPGVVILNAGLLHRIGPNRLHVHIARRLAHDGCRVLRFDQGGLGDSPPRTDRLPFHKAAEREVGEAVDALTAARSLHSVVLLGICSGADYALKAACADRRITGCVLVDPFNMLTLGPYLHMRRHRIASLRSWLRLLSGRSEVWTDTQTAVAQRRAAGGREVVHSAHLSRRGMVRAVEELAGRGTRILLVYTAESPAYYHYRRTLHRRVRAGEFGDRVRTEYIADTDHTFTLACSQERLLDLLAAWIQEPGRASREATAPRPATPTDADA